MIGVVARKVPQRLTEWDTNPAHIPIIKINKGRVKIAKAQAMNIDFQKDNAKVKASSELWQLYEEARNLNVSMQEYKETFQDQQDLTLLKQALAGGQISMIEYFVEVSVVYQSKTNLLQLENQYQKAMARIYKNEL